jgi:hypothetical protein
MAKYQSAFYSANAHSGSYLSGLYGLRPIILFFRFLTFKKQFDIPVAQLLNTFAP